jgi:hypothetical protein
MITITQKCNQWKVQCSAPGFGQRGFHVMAENWAEVHEAINHIVGAGTSQHPYSDDNAKCPLCRSLKAKGAKA